MTRNSLSVPDGVTHVVAYFPADMFPEGAWPGGWELRTLSDYDPDAHWGKTGGAPAVAYPDPDPDECGLDEVLLAEWVAGQVGYPVELTWDRVQIKPKRLARWRSVPVCYVTPGGQS